MLRSHVLKNFMKPATEPYRFPEAAEPPEQAAPLRPETEPKTAPETEPETQEDPQPEKEDFFDFAAVQSDAIVSDARRQAEQIREEARAAARGEAEQIREGARQEGFREGYAQGLSAAAEQTRQQREEQAARMEADLKAFLEQATRAQADLIDRTKDDMRDLAVAVAEKVIRVSLKSSSAVIAKMIQGATEKLKRREWVRIYIAGCDAHGIAQVTPGLTLSLAALSDHIKLVPMAEEESGTCIIETPDTIIDASSTTQLSNIRTLLAEISPEDTPGKDIYRRISDR